MQGSRPPTSSTRYSNARHCRRKRCPTCPSRQEHLCLSRDLQPQNLRSPPRMRRCMRSRPTRKHRSLPQKNRSMRLPPQGLMISVFSYIPTSCNRIVLILIYHTLLRNKMTFHILNMTFWLIFSEKQRSLFSSELCSRSAALFLELPHEVVLASVAALLRYLHDTHVCMFEKLHCAFNP